MAPRKLLLGLPRGVRISRTCPPTRISHKWCSDPENTGLLCRLAHLPAIFPSFDPWRRGRRASAKKELGLETLSEEGAKHSPNQNKSPDCDQGKLKLGLGTMPVEPLHETGGEAMRHLKHPSEHSKSFPCMVHKQSRELRAAVDHGPKPLCSVIPLPLLVPLEQGWDFLSSTGGNVNQTRDLM